jgi:hypothetical protein
VRRLVPFLAFAFAACAAAEAEPVVPAPAAEAGEEGPPAPPFDEGALPPELAEVARKVRDQPIGARMAAISEPLLGTPYLIDATGEGREPDLDPPARYDAFDCLTFVEEIMALAIAPDPRSAPAIRNDLRWGRGRARTYENRHHFMLQQWIPRAIEAGYLADITHTLGETHRIQKTVTPKTWRWWKKRELFKVPDSKLPVGDYELQVLSLAEAARVAEQIPDGALILTVRQSKDYVPIVVSHLGFKVPSADPEVPFMRHATKMGKVPRVRNDKLKYYLEHVRWYHWWPVEGVTVLMPQEAGPRVSRTVDTSRPGGPALAKTAPPRSSTKRSAR